MLCRLHTPRLLKVAAIVAAAVLGFETIPVVAQDSNNTSVPIAAPNDTSAPTTTTSTTSAPSIPTNITTAPVFAPVPIRSCYTNLTEIEILVRMKNPFISETYILCPNTIYEIGFPDETGQSFNGPSPIFTRSKSIFSCGDDGLSSNNCTITGGDYQVFHDPLVYPESHIVEVVMKGLTFDDARSGSIILSASGDITFIDCIFRNHQNSGVMLSVYFNSNARRLGTRLEHNVNVSNAVRKTSYDSLILTAPVSTGKNIASANNDLRRMQDGDELNNGRLKVTIDRCLFENNYNGEESPTTYDGLISTATEFNDFIITNSIFQLNDFSAPVVGSDGYAIKVAAGTKLTISNCCFIDNSFAGAGVVIVEGQLEDFVSINNYGTIDTSLDCTYASVVGNNSCVDYESASCEAESLQGSSSNPNPNPNPTPVGSTPTSPTTATENSTSSSFSANRRQLSFWRWMGVYIFRIFLFNCV